MGETKPTDLLREYGAAIRGDWGMIDGRTVRMELGSIADLIEESGNAAMLPEDLDQWRGGLDICPHGNGHWTEHCSVLC